MVLFAGLFIGLASACSVGSDGPSEVRDGSFAVGDSPKVIVSSENGTIIINSGPDREVTVKATLRQPDDIDYEVSQVGDVITIISEADNGGFLNFGPSPGADIEITTPANTEIEILIKNGPVEVYGIQRDGSVRTFNGPVVLDDVSGNFNIVTSNRAVTITQATGSFNVETGTGRITFDGELTSGGDNKMTTSNGSVEIKLQGTPSVKFDGSISDGSISTEFPTLTSSLGDEHHLVGTIGSGDAALLVRASNGSIEIR
jgi:hypothetical protein